MSKKTVNLKIPVELVAQLQNYLAELQVEEESDEEVELNLGENVENAEQLLEEEEYYEDLEVQSVINHRVNKKGEYSFEIKFKRYQGTHWIHDNDCNCEYLISKYLKKMDINTAYLICRVSTKEQTSCTSTSLEGQEDELRKTVLGRGYDRIKVYKISSSAYKNIPRVLENLTSSLNGSDSLWVWRVDRLSRNIIKYLDWLEKLDAKGVQINAFSEKLNYKDNKLDFIQKIVDAQKESHAIGQRVRLSYKRKRERGDEAIGGLAYGKKYQRIMNGDNTKIVRKVVRVNKEENKIIQFVRSNRMNDYEMRDHLNKKGITKRGRKWTVGMVKRMRYT